MYCAQFDVYSHDKLIATRVGRFQTQQHAEKLINNWNDIGSKQEYKWNYRNVKQVPNSEWKSDALGHADHFTSETY